MPLGTWGDGARVIVVPLDPLRPDPDAIERAAEVLRRGGLVAFPTETVYGVGANALDAEAVGRIFAAKSRPSYNPLIAHVAGIGAARRLASSWPELADRAAEAFWPGPLTLVVPRAGHVPDIVTAGLATVAVRVPRHPVALALLEACGVPVAAPSANRFTEISPTTAAHVARGMGEGIDMILDGGPTRVGIESTVLDLSGEEPSLLRPGSIPLPELERVVGRIRIAAPIAGAAARPSPGMTERHYSPRAELHVVEPAKRGEIDALVARARARGHVIGALLLQGGEGAIDHPLRMPADAAKYARRLYAALHELDDAGCDLILAEAVPDEPEWAGVRDRLTRAAWRG